MTGSRWVVLLGTLAALAACTEKPAPTPEAPKAPPPAEPAKPAEAAAPTPPTEAPAAAAPADAEKPAEAAAAAAPAEAATPEKPAEAAAPAKPAEAAAKPAEAAAKPAEAAAKPAEAAAPAKPAEAAAPAGGGSYTLVAIPEPDKKIEKLWKSKCSSCHGADGKAATEKGKKMQISDFTAAAWQTRRTNAALKKSIAEGTTGEKNGVKQEMDPYKDELADDQIDALVTFVRWLGAPK